MKKFLLTSALIPCTLLLTATLAHAFPPGGGFRPSGGSSGGIRPSGGSGYKPSYTPTYKPSYTPTYKPSYTPTYKPSYTPTYKPNSGSTYKPGGGSTYKPGGGSSFKPSGTGKTTFNPSKNGASSAGFTKIKNPTSVKAFNSNVRVNSRQYASKYGTRLKSGYTIYRGSKHNQWTRRFYSGRWRCWCWYDPCTLGWYYWCGDKSCYLPVRYLVVEAPTTCDQTDTDVEGPPDGGDVTLASNNEEPDLPDIKEP